MWQNPFIFHQVFAHESASNITLHAADLTIQNDTISVARVGEEEEEMMVVTGVQYDKDREFIIINTRTELETGASYKVTIDYTAYLKDNLKGFYRWHKWVIYPDSGKKKEIKTVLVTDLSTPTPRPTHQSTSLSLSFRQLTQGELFHALTNLESR